MKSHIIIAVVCLVIGLVIGLNWKQSANGLLQAGFHIYDPEGYEVESFDNGPTLNYWTTQPKP